MRNPFLRTRTFKRLKFHGDVVFFIKKKKHKGLFTHTVTVTVTVNLLTLCQWKQTVFLQNGFCTHLVRKRSISIDTRLKFDGDGDGHGMCKQTLRSIHTEWLRHRHRNIDGQHLWSLTETVTGRMGCIPIFASQRNGVAWCEWAFKQHSYLPMSGQDSYVLCPLGAVVIPKCFIKHVCFIVLYFHGHAFFLWKLLKSAFLCFICWKMCFIFVSYLSGWNIYFKFLFITLKYMSCRSLF